MDARLISLKVQHFPVDALAPESSRRSTRRRLLCKRCDLSDVDPERQPAGSFPYVA